MVGVSAGELAGFPDREASRPAGGVPAAEEEDQGSAALHLHHRGAAGRRPRAVVLPDSGLRTAENLRPCRHFCRGSARLLAATIREWTGRWVVALRVEITAPRQPPPPGRWG
jgi:hypothetical protein